MKKIKQYGYKKSVVTEKSYVLGGFSKIKGEVINPSGNWEPYKPDFEPQSIPNLETQACTTFATLNALEALIKFHDNK